VAFAFNMSNLAVAQVVNDHKLEKVSDASKYQILSDCNAVRGPAVHPGVSYACVVGEVAHSGPIPERRTPTTDSDSDDEVA
jgi:hypothetical protein